MGHPAADTMDGRPPDRGLIGRALYRLRQGLEALLTRLRPLDVGPAREYLSPELYLLFDGMPRREKQHAISVLNKLRDMGAANQDLMAAALLHDVGKSLMPFSLPERVAVVLANAICPSSAAMWGRGEPKGFRRPFVIHAQHPVWGAEMAEKAGASPLTVELIRRHQDPLSDPPRTESDRLLIMLKAADDAA